MTKIHGTIELHTENLILRRYRPEDAAFLYEHFGADPEMVKYSGWNPHATMEMARATVRNVIESYTDDHSYSWVMDVDGHIVGTIGAYDYEHDRIEVGYSVDREWQGHGYATEALKKVLAYLTENEGISCVKAWCAAENIGSKRVLEKADFKFVRTEQDGVVVDERTYDKLVYEYRDRE